MAMWTASICVMDSMHVNAMSRRLRWIECVGVGGGLRCRGMNGRATFVWGVGTTTVMGVSTMTSYGGRRLRGVRKRVLLMCCSVSWLIGKESVRVESASEYAMGCTFAALSRAHRLMKNSPGAVCSTVIDTVLFSYLTVVTLNIPITCKNEMYVCGYKRIYDMLIYTYVCVRWRSR